MRPRRDPYGQLTQPGKTEMSRKVRHLKWSHAEKQIARKAFELALDREFRSVIRRAKDMAGKIEQPTDLWDLEHNLTESRKRIDRTYDYRYSVLTDVFGRLVREVRLSEDELQGLGEDKLQSIRSYARLLAKLDEVA
jgi:Asp-tRNA(Asn)/Glu-tRNA(Gln) amidotransferase B subunit